MRISTICGAPASPLGLAAYPDQDPQCVPRAVECGINFLFFYSAGQKLFIEALKPIVRAGRDKIILASGSGSRTSSGLRAARRKILSAVGTEMIDIFFAEYIHPGDDAQVIFGSGGVLDELQHWKAKGWIRYVGTSAHDRKLATKLATDCRVDVLMHRFNMAHRKAATEVFPAAIGTQTPVIAFTATRWRTLLTSHPEWPGQPPTAADCYRYCLARQAVHLVLTSPESIEELDENITVLTAPPMNEEVRGHWERFGDIIYKNGGGRTHNYESRWP
jgi:aryl-alcohol dehydrogenase-like predicted oxidoreductase